MQEQSQQTLLPGLKLSYDHPHLAERRFCRKKELAGRGTLWYRCSRSERREKDAYFVVVQVKRNACCGGFGGRRDRILRSPGR